MREQATFVLSLGHHPVARHIGWRLLFIFCLMIPLLSSAQDAWQSKSIDEIFGLARREAFDGNREQARVMLNYILEKSPDYHDVRVLLGRTYAWDGKKDEARREFQSVLGKDNKHEDALQALVDVELWDDQYEHALTITDVALKYYPTNEEFLFKRARALSNLKRENEAMIALHTLLAINPSHEQGLALLQTIKTQQLKYTVGVSYNLDVFSRTFDPAHYAAAQIGRTNRWGTSILRFNYAHRFDTHGFQPEVDLYPKIVKGVYLYLNYGYSTTDLFPEHRGGAEIFTKLPKSLEASAGLRYLYFNTDSKVTILTGSLGWYFKSYWLSVRPYVTPNNETGTSVSTTVTVRKYFADADNFIGISAGVGFSPDERRYQSGAGLTSDGIYRLKSQRIGFAWNKTLAHHFLLTTSLDFQRQELISDEGKYIIISSLGLGVRKRF